MKLSEANAQDIPVLCRLIAKKPINHMKNIEDLRKNAEYVFQTASGEAVDVSDIKEWRGMWPIGHTYTYQMTNYSKDPLIKDTKKQDMAMKVAVRQFTLVARHLKLKWKRDNKDGKRADFRFEWSSDLSVFGGNDRVLAQAYLPTNNPRTSTYSGLIQINDIWNWSFFGSAGAQFLVQVLIHEFFHSLGFVHDEKDRNSTLYPYANGKMFFTNRDKTRIWLKYVRRMLPEWLIKIMMNRLVNKYDFD